MDSTIMAGWLKLPRANRITAFASGTSLPVLIVIFNALTTDGAISDPLTRKSFIQICGIYFFISTIVFVIGVSDISDAFHKATKNFREFIFQIAMIGDRCPKFGEE